MIIQIDVFSVYNTKFSADIQVEKGLGRHWPKGLSLVDIMRKFPDDEAAEKWFIATRWPTGVACPRCGSTDIHIRANRQPMPYWCSVCQKYFSVKTGTVMQSSKLGLQTWAVAIYLMSTSLKGVSSMKLHRDLGITQKSAWNLAHRIRECWQEGEVLLSGPVDVDEKNFGGKRKNMSN